MFYVSPEGGILFVRQFKHGNFTKKNKKTNTHKKTKTKKKQAKVQIIADYLSNGVASKLSPIGHPQQFNVI